METNTEGTMSEQLLKRCQTMQIDHGKVIYVLCWGDVLAAILKQLYEQGLKPGDLADEEIRAMLDAAREYLCSEEQPLRKVLQAGIQNAWPERLAQASPGPEDGAHENPD
jgi:hypothetical protein